MEPVGKQSNQKRLATPGFLALVLHQSTNVIVLSKPARSPFDWLKMPQNAGPELPVQQVVDRRRVEVLGKIRAPLRHHCGVDAMLNTKPPEHPPIFAAFDVRRIKNPVVGSEGRPQEFVVAVRVGVIDPVRGISQEKVV